jgi:hypothetical protein
MYAIIYRRKWTQSQVGKPEFYNTKNEAEQKATAFNRYNQDYTWNAVIAIVHNVAERLRA